MFLEGTLLSWIVVVGALQPAGAQLVDVGDSDQPFEINADSLTYENERDIYIATGNVHIKQGDGALDADWVSFSTMWSQPACGSWVFSQESPTSVQVARSGWSAAICAAVAKVSSTVR